MAANYGWTFQKDEQQQFNNQLIGHYWVVWDGSVPSTAVKAGVDKDGGDLYVGRASHEGDLIPAKVVENQNCAYVCYGGQEHCKREFEVLCRGSSTVIWASSTSGGIPPGALRIGVTVNNESLYVGRVFHEGTLTVGKVQPSHGVCYIPYDGQEIPYSEYEVLVLN